MAATTKVFFATQVFGVNEMVVDETRAALDLKAVAAETAQTTVGGATGRMVTITESSTGVAHQINVELIAGYVDLAARDRA